MGLQKIRQLAGTGSQDDSRLFCIRRDLSGGVNNRQVGSMIGDNQAVVLYNVDVGTVGESSKRLGSTLIGNDVGSDTVLGLHNFQIQGETDQLLAYYGTSLSKWVGTGNWTSLKADFTASTEVGFCQAKESGLAPDDIVIVQNGVDNAFRLDSDGNFQDLGDTNTSPPITTVMTWYNNRVWGLKNDLLYFSDAYDFIGISYKSYIAVFK